MGKKRAPRPGVPAFRKKIERGLDAYQTGRTHLEKTDLVHGAVSVFYGPEHAAGHHPVSLEIEHRINHMLQYFRSRNGSFLCDMSYEYVSNLLLFQLPDQP